MNHKNKSRKTGIREKSQKILQILKELEPLFRLVEVVIIGVAGISVSILANNIADTANDIANRELEISEAEIQPVFQIDQITTSNTAGDEKADSEIVVEVVSGSAENIICDTETALKVVYLLPESDTFEELEIELDDYYSVNAVSAVKNGVISRLYYDNNFQNYYTAYTGIFNDTTYDNAYLEINTVLKLSYVDVSKKTQEEYYQVSAVNTIHLNHDSGKELFNRYAALEDKISVEDLSLETIDAIVTAKTDGQEN